MTSVLFPRVIVTHYVVWPLSHPEYFLMILANIQSTTSSVYYQPISRAILHYILSPNSPWSYLHGSYITSWERMCLILS